MQRLVGNGGVQQGKCVKCGERNIFYKDAKQCSPCYKHPINKRYWSTPEAKQQRYERDQVKRERKRQLQRNQAQEHLHRHTQQNGNENEEREREMGDTNEDEERRPIFGRVHLRKIKRGREMTGDFCDLVADIHGAHGVSTSTTATVINRVLCSDIGGNIQIPRRHTVCGNSVSRATVAKAELIKDQLAKQISRLSYLGLACDKTSVFYDRAFIEVHFLGWNPHTQLPFNKLWGYIELDPSIRPIQAVTECLRDVQRRQTLMGVPIVLLVVVMIVDSVVTVVNSNCSFDVGVLQT